MTVLDNCIKSINKAKQLKNLNIFINDTFELALEQAEKSQIRYLKKSPLSKLDGLTFSVKDNICTKTINTTCGSKMLENYVPPNDATVVERLLNSGSILIGKTNLDEFGMGSVSSSYFGTVKNPINLKDQTNNDFYITGGSSGGSAASVSAGIVDFSIGSDTGGSVRNPASICGCIGFKPTYGLISRYGLIPLNNYFDTIGIMSQSMQILVDVLNIIAGPDSKDATSIKSEFKPIELENNLDLKNIKIGIPQEFFPNGLSASNLESWQKCVEIFANIGQCKIIPVSLPNTLYTMSCYSVLTSCEVASNFARYDGLRFGYHSKLDLDMNLVDEIDYNFEKIVTQNRDESLGKVVKSRIVSGNYFLLKDNYEKYFLKSHKIRQMIANDFKKCFNQVDLLITPTCFHDTIKYEEYLRQEQVFDEKDFFTACANIAGIPGISVPSLTNRNGLPVGVQFLTSWNRDNFLLNISNWFLMNNKI